MKKDYDPENPFILYRELSHLASNAALRANDLGGYVHYKEESDLYQRRADIWEMLRRIGNEKSSK